MAKESQLQTLYSKLYHKYNKMKKEKDSVMEKLNQDQETKFMSYVEASDEMIEYLKSENDRLCKQVSELRRDVSTIRSTKDEECIKYQTLLMEENQRNKELMEEIERLRNLQQEGRCCQGKDNKDKDGSVDIPRSSQAKSSSSEILKRTRKRSRQSLSALSNTEEVEHVQLTVSADRSSERMGGSDSPLNYSFPACCKRKKVNSGSCVTECGPASCFFQDLVECIVDLKLSCIVQNEEFGVSALHPSSGYSFSLTWINNSHGEPELLYRVLSLGTFERVAPEWMRDVLMFGTSMCPVFFQRVSRIIKLNH